jgi:hypothetical protein
LISKTIDKSVERLKPIIRPFLAEVYDRNSELRLSVGMVDLDDNHLFVSIEPGPQFGGGALSDGEGFAAVLILKGEQAVGSDGDVPELPIAQILRLLKEIPVNVVVLHIDIRLSLAGQEGLVQVESLEPHLFVDDLGEPVIMQGHVLRSGLWLNRKSAKVSAVAEFDLAGIIDSGLP